MLTGEIFVNCHKKLYESKIITDWWITSALKLFMYNSIITKIREGKLVVNCHKKLVIYNSKI